MLEISDRTAIQMLQFMEAQTKALQGILSELNRLDEILTKGITVRK